MAEPIGNFTDKTPAINAVGESLRVYNQLMPIWQSHMRGEITREDFEAASRRIWDAELEETKRTAIEAREVYGD